MPPMYTIHSTIYLSIVPKDLFIYIYIYIYIYIDVP